MQAFNTLSEAINTLKSQGYIRDFNLIDHGLECSESREIYLSGTLNVDAVFRFEGMNDPDDSSVLYAISTEKGDKGLLLDAYGVYAESVSPEMLKKLKIHP
ncbi:MAG: phosphoribosylpyrophosphate synthetase [Bacteroidetes bacterium]|nr:phosphoribosylpyrophosphate synthetase [Bacteroidota bacterium]